MLACPRAEPPRCHLGGDRCRERAAAVVAGAVGVGGMWKRRGLFSRPPRPIPTTGNVSLPGQGGSDTFQYFGTMIYYYDILS